MRIRTVTKPRVAPAFDFQDILTGIGMVASTVSLVFSAAMRVKEFLLGQTL